MTSATLAPTLAVNQPSKGALWTGRVLSTLVVLMLAFGAVMSLPKPTSVLEEFDRLGYPRHLAVTIGVLELCCAILYAIPATSILGAIVLTGYLGGATATHIRIGEMDKSIFPVIFGMIAWLALFLREPRLRSLIPLRR
jgi:hypothetical protein